MSSTNFLYYRSPIISYGAVFKQLLCIDLQCVISGSLQENIFDYVRIRFFWYVWITCANKFKVTFHFSSSLWRFFYYVTTTLSMLLLQQHIFNGIKITFFFGTFKLHIKLLYNYVVSWFVIMRYFILCDNKIFPGS